MDDLNTAIRGFILRQFLPGEPPESLTDELPLMTGGILDSISTLKMVDHLESTYNIRFKAHEVDSDHLDTVSDIADLVREKQADTTP